MEIFAAFWAWVGFKIGHEKIHLVPAEISAPRAMLIENGTSVKYNAGDPSRAPQLEDT